MHLTLRLAGKRYCYKKNTKMLLEVGWDECNIKFLLYVSVLVQLSNVNGLKTVFPWDKCTYSPFFYRLQIRRSNFLKSQACFRFSLSRKVESMRYKESISWKYRLTILRKQSLNMTWIIHSSLSFRIIPISLSSR